MFSKYFTIYRLSVATQLSYRLNFFLGRARNIIILIVLYAIFSALTSQTSFAGYSQEEFITYIFLIHLLRSFIFGSQSRLAATEINNGTFSTYLLRPVTHYVYNYIREFSERITLMVTALFELGIFWLIVQPNLLWQNDSLMLVGLFISVLLAHILYALFSYLVSMIAFWSREAMGPRFLFEWLLEMTSGAYFPLTILSAPLFAVLQLLPFMYMIFVPLQIYLGKVESDQILHTLGLQLIWILILSAVVFVTWKQGLKKYSAEGI